VLFEGEYFLSFSYNQAQFIYYSISSDGLHWTKVVPPFIPYAIEYIEEKDMYYACCSNGRIFQSSDLQNWKLAFQLPTTETLNAIAYGDSTWVIFDYSGDIWTATE
jgi:hypothetical protein